ncbi:MAG: dihydrofolate reductase family protein [Candidatus Microbacterium colombiense]|nr:MAG: dihydrofolate reductase family protein [Microbacterium sp.]
MNLDRSWRGCVFIGTSLDGYIAKPDGDLSWLTEPEHRAHIAEEGAHPGLIWETFFPTVDALVMGRTTYDTVSGFDEWPFDGATVVVLSTTLTESEHARIARSVDEVSAILAEVEAKRVYVDGGRTIQSFLAAGLIDEITVSIAPILLGRGSRLFGDLDRDVLLTLRGHHSTGGDGLVRITYDVVPR